MSLKTRILGLAASLIIVASVASWLAYRELSESIIERWGQQVAEIQVRYSPWSGKSGWPNRWPVPPP